MATAVLTKRATLNCAVYTRKSTDENLNTDFNSLDSQREYCQSFIKSREGEGWKLYPEEYSDPAFSGGNMNRPALRKLLADAAQKKFQVVVCYKYDRLSRNTKDFLHILEIFDRYGIAFVSVTQPIDTTSSVGRLMRSILMDFSQFEREMIGERTRDKIAAMARKGKRIGGMPVLGFDLDPDSKRLVVNPKEAEQVREIFELYLRTRSLCTTAKTLNARGQGIKIWTTHEGKKRGGTEFDRSNLHYLLLNPIYIGKIRYKGTLFDGEHEAIVPEATAKAVRETLKANGHGVHQRHIEERKHEYLLGGLVRCACCQSMMTPSHSRPRKADRFFYYRCESVIKMDRSSCKVRSVPARALEEFVLKRIELLSENKELVETIVKRGREFTGQQLPQKRDEKSRLSAALGKAEAESKNLVEVLAKEGTKSKRYDVLIAALDEITARQEDLGAKLMALESEIQELEKRNIDAEVLRRNLGNFLKIFQKLNHEEQKELLRLLIQEVLYDGGSCRVRIALKPLPEAWGDMETLEGTLPTPTNAHATGRALRRSGQLFEQCSKDLPD